MSDPDLIKNLPGVLPDKLNDFLWKLFTEICDAWKIDCHSSNEMASAFRECVRLKCEEDPSYLGEYRNAENVINTLIKETGSKNAAFFKLLFETKVDDPRKPQTELEHCKVYVVDEFISLVVISGGFKDFGSLNYGGYIGGSRFRSDPPYKTPPLYRSK